MLFKKTILNFFFSESVVILSWICDKLKKQMFFFYLKIKKA